MNKTNHPRSSNSHPSATANNANCCMIYSATANKAIHSLKKGGLQNQREHHIILTKYEVVHRCTVYLTLTPGIYALMVLATIPGTNNSLTRQICRANVTSQYKCIDVFRELRSMLAGKRVVSVTS